MPEAGTPAVALESWKHLLGEQPEILEHFEGRDLWRVKAGDGRCFYLKRYGPWRNLPLVDEARVLRYLASNGITVAEMLPTYAGVIHAGNVEESFVLFPELESVQLNAAETLASEPAIGHAMARLHHVLARYPGPIYAYHERLEHTLQHDMLLPSSLERLFVARKDEMLSALSHLPTQIVHGDMTPGNILMKEPGVVSGFIDFDHLPFAPRAWDIAKYLSRRLRMRWRAEDATASHDRCDHIAPFLRAYIAANPLTSGEIAAIPSLIAAANVIETSYFLQISAGTLPRRMLADHEAVTADSAEAAEWQFRHWNVVSSAIDSI